MEELHIRLRVDGLASLVRELTAETGEEAA